MISEIEQKIEHIAHNIAIREDKLSFLCDEDRREYMKRFKKGKKAVIDLLHEYADEQKAIIDKLTDYREENKIFYAPYPTINTEEDE